MKGFTERALVLMTGMSSLLGCSESERFVGSVLEGPIVQVEMPDAARVGNMQDDATDAGNDADAMSEPVELGPFSVPVQIVELSQPDHDQYDAALSEDKLTIFYRSEPRMSAGTGRSEIVMATRAAAMDAWGAPTLIASIDADTAWNLAPELSQDGLALWFSSDRNGGTGGLDLWVARRSSVLDPWSSVEPLTTLNTTDWDTDLTVDTRQSCIVFSRRPEGQDSDFFISCRNSVADAWPSATELLELNSDGDDWDAAFGMENRALLFASNRSQDPRFSGALHLYEARRASEASAFSQPVLIEELNAPGAIDEDPWLSRDGRHVVFSSTRAGRRHLYESFR